MTILPENTLGPQRPAWRAFGLAVALAFAPLLPFTGSSPAYGQDYGQSNGQPASPAQSSSKAKKAKKAKKPTKVNEIAARKKACRTYKNRLIGYYGKVFRVSGCKRHPVENTAITSQIRRYGAVRTVDADIVKLIPLAKQRVKRRLTCRESEGRVFLTLSGQIFQVAGCRRYTFPDWETFLEYRKKGRVKGRSFVEVEDHLAQTLPEARVYPSVLDADSAAFLRDNEEYDIIPAKRACRGLEGRYMTYYSQVYKIERCKRRPVTIEAAKLARLKLKELTSSQWLSIPEGKPLKK